MQRSIGILAVISTMNVLVLAELYLRDPLTQLTLGQNVISDNSTVSSTKKVMVTGPSSSRHVCNYI